MKYFIKRLTRDATIFGNQCYSFLAFAIFSTLFFSTSLQANPLSISVTGSDGSPVVSYRWLLEEDQTYNVVPGQTCYSGNYADCQALNFHKSYMPVVAEGHSVSDPMPTIDLTKRYYISVLPDANYTIGGTNVAIGATNASITVGPIDVPTAQIRVQVFRDKAPINGVPEGLLTEPGIPGIKITVEDAGGRYGISGQHIVNDVYGNPMGTTYISQGVVDVMGDGSIHTGPDGFVTIKHLAPGKYGIQAVPPTGSTLVQTSTIEGKKLVDAWVQADEPAFFQEFGPARPPGPHVFIGFAEPTNTLPISGGATITGTITSLHNSRPPEFTFHSGATVGGCWVGLNESIGGVAKGEALFVAPCDGNSNFSIPNVPAGTYQMVIWDEALNYLISYKAVTVSATDSLLALGDVPIFAWFARLEQKVFNDANENGIWDPGEVPMPEQGTAIRWRDGTVYQSFPTDLGGEAPYDEVFPFFHWLVAEVAFDRFKATGVTVRVDDGGSLLPGEVLNPQPQNENEGQGFRVETGPVLTQAFQGFAGQTSVIEWGKTPYPFGENGGISGIVYYATTRAEDDPRYAGAEPWEPGIPRIQVALYQDNNDGASGGPDGIIDDMNGIAGVQLADVDNAPFGNFPTLGEDFDYNGNGTFDAGDAIQIGTTDSWDDNLPTNCQGDTFIVDGVFTTDCFDGLRNFNQVRPAVFDGGYAFDSYFPGGVDSDSTEVDGLPSGTYIVATGKHNTYKTVKEEDRNVDFGDNFVIPDLLPPTCVGDDHLVPPTFSLFGPDGPTSAGQLKPVCDRKQILLSGSKNAAADFMMFTLVPPSGHLTGVMLNDLANEFDPNAPAFGEKFAPPNLPISIRDWQGNEVSRSYSDRWGMYNALVPSTYTNNLPSSSGISPSMLTSCMNDPGPVNINGSLVTDPNYKREYAQFCYTWQYMPGVTTYLDTPIFPIAAFTTAGNFPLDCEFPEGTPVIWSTQGAATGPIVAVAGDSLTLVSAGTVNVKNPDFNGTNSETISRDFGFGGTKGKITLNGTPVSQTDITMWDNDMIQVNVPAGGGQLEIQRGDNGISTRTGIHVTVGGTVVSVPPGGSIQTAINNAAVGDTVIIPPGTFNESVIMYKPIRLQGSGASTIINAANFSGGSQLQQWRAAVEGLYNAGAFDLLPPQGTVFGPTTLLTEQGAGILVLGKNNPKDGFAGKETRIDGISIIGSHISGGIIVNGYAHELEISNNRVFNNSGAFSGGIRLGHPNFIENSINSNLNIHNNYIAENGGFAGAGGGISLYRGSDSYSVANNYICGNYATSDGAGIAHQGLSTDGQITGNSILFNQSFNQGITVAGGGISIAGQVQAGGLTDGSGSITIDSNLIQGNNAGAGNGGGISLSLVNGVDAGDPDPTTWYSVDITNNKIVNNVTGLAGGGISLQDAARVNISNNTVAHNDSTATSGEAFCDISTGLICDPNVSTPRAAGIVAYQHSSSLLAGISQSVAADPLNDFSNPDMDSNIIWENRSFYFSISNATTFGLIPDVSGGAPAVFDDLAVYPGTAGVLNPLSGTLTDVTGYDASNTDVDPLFVLDYFNGSQGTGIQLTEFTTISTPSVQPAFDEGGNFIDVRYGPLSPVGNYNFLLPPIAPTLLAPSGNIGANNMPTYSWNSQAGATFYKLWIKDPNGVVSQLWYTPTQANCAGTSTLDPDLICSIETTTPLDNGGYSWKVRSRNSLALGPWSAALAFSIAAAPVAPTQVAPSGDIGANNTPDFTWLPQEGVTNYKLWIKDPNGIVSQIWYIPSDAGCNVVTPTTTCTIGTPSALANGNYTWKVRSRNSVGLGPWSPTLSFSIGALPAATMLEAPSSNIGTNNTPYFTWFPQEGATNYKFWIMDPNGVVSQTWYLPGSVSCDGVITPKTLCTLPTTTALINGNYRWRVRTRNSLGLGPWSALVLFNVNAP